MKNSRGVSFVLFGKRYLYLIKEIHWIWTPEKHTNTNHIVQYVYTELRSEEMPNLDNEQRLELTFTYSS